MLHFLAVLFNWPQGIVDGNLIASAMWAGPAFLHLHVKMNRQHKQTGARISQLE